MKHKEDTWGWMLAVDFFFAGMGGGMLLIIGLADLFRGKNLTSVLANFAAPLCIAIGAALLVLELGRPFQSWRVFVNPKAILTIGAWSMLAAIGFGLLYATFSIASLPWSGLALLRKSAALGCAFFGLVVATYPGILLGRHKSRPFWTGPAMAVLFLAASLATGAALHLLCGLILPPSKMALVKALPLLIAGLLGLQLVFWLVYLWVKMTGTTSREAIAVQGWINGEKAAGFWGIFLGAGTILPIALVLLPGEMWKALGIILVLLGGLWMRLNVVKSGETRTWLPGEEHFRARLPHGDEAFLKAFQKK